MSLKVSLPRASYTLDGIKADDGLSLLRWIEANVGGVNKYVLTTEEGASIADCNALTDLVSQGNGHVTILEDMVHYRT